MHSLPNENEIRQLREFLSAEDYTEQRLLEIVHTHRAPTPQQRDLAKLLYFTSESNRLNRLIRWFLGGVAVNRNEAETLFPDWFLDLGLRCGILSSNNTDTDTVLEPGILIEPHGDLLVAADTYQKMASESGYDYVLSLSPTAQYLLNFTIREPVKTLLDLGTGSGIQALVAARHSAQITATDLNIRAVLFTQFNALLNNITQIEPLSGDMLQPVAGRQFDLVVSNPPFVLAPSADYLYRDNQFELDQLCGHLAQHIPAHLNEGGYFQMLCDWVQLSHQPWQERIQQWFKNTGCDVMVFKQYTQHPHNYALTRLRETLQTSVTDDNTAYQQWLDYYRTKNVIAVHGGLIVMRKRSTHNTDHDDNWLIIEELSGNLDEPFGSEILQRFKSQDDLSAHTSDDAMLQTTPRLADNISLDHQQYWQDSRWHTRHLSLVRNGAMRQTINIDHNIVDFLAHLDGQRQLGDQIETLIAQVSTAPEQVRAQVLATIRMLIERGYMQL